MPATRVRHRRKPCSICAARGAETYGYYRRRWVFDVDRARKLVSDGRQPIELSAADLEFCVETTRIHWMHVPHVDVQYPGIMAHVWHTHADGRRTHGHVLIDGNHRAARCLMMGRPFYIYVLSEAESRRILLREPKGADCECARCRAQRRRRRSATAQSTRRSPRRPAARKRTVRRSKAARRPARRTG